MILVYTSENGFLLPVLIHSQHYDTRAYSTFVMTVFKCIYKWNNCWILPLSYLSFLYLNFETQNRQACSWPHDGYLGSWIFHGLVFLQPAKIRWDFIGRLVRRSCVFVASVAVGVWVAYAPLVVLWIEIQNMLLNITWWKSNPFPRTFTAIKKYLPTTLNVYFKPVTVIVDIFGFKYILLFLWIFFPTPCFLSSH